MAADQPTRRSSRKRKRRNGALAPAPACIPAAAAVAVTVAVLFLGGVPPTASLVVPPPACAVAIPSAQPSPYGSRQREPSAPSGGHVKPPVRPSRDGESALQATPGPNPEDIRAGALIRPWHRLRGSLSSLRATYGGSDNPGMVAALFVTYFTVLGAKCSLPSTIPLLPAALAYPPGTDPSAALSHLLTASTLSIVCGKVVLGPLIDWVGGVRSLQIALVVLLSSLLCISTTSSFYPTFFVAWCLVDLTFSACWAAALSAVHETLDEKEWAGTVGLLAMGARLGNAAAFSGFAAILACGERIGYGARDGGGGSGSWRAVFAAAAAVQAMSLVLLSAFGRNKTRATRGHAQLGEMIAEQEGAPSPPPSSSVRKSLWLLGSVASTPQFWLHGISRSALTVVASFLLFVPSLMSQCFGLTDGAAAGVGSLYAAGCLVGVGVGSQRWYANQVPGRSRAAAVATQLGTVIATSLLLMLHVGGGLTLPAPAGALLLFLYAVGFAVPFYLPPSLYALEVGGGTSSATIADAFDIGGFSLLAAFNGYVGRIVGGGWGKMGAAGAAADSKDWIPAFVILTFCALASMASLIWATLLDAREVRGIGVEGA